VNAELRTVRTNAEQALIGAWENARVKLPGGPEVGHLREQAFAAFAESGLPHRRIEEWKYTDLRTLLREAAPLAGPPSAAAIARAKESDPLAGTELRRLVFVDGAFVAALSDLAALERNVTIVPLAKALAEGHRLAPRLAALQPQTYDAAFALNTAFLADGVLIEVGEGAELERPIHVRHVFGGPQPAATFTRTLLVVGDRANASLVESFEGPDGVAYQANAALSLQIGDKAKAAVSRLQIEGDAAFHVATTLAEIGAGSELWSGALTTGAAVSRHSMTVRFAGQRSSAHMAAATLLRRRQHADTTLLLDHAVPACDSREVFKSVLDDESRGIVQGRVVVRPGAQKTDARMLLGALLLSQSAEADHKPELEIFADDVQCGHGATSGALDEQLLFYLLARGIPRKQAEALLIQAFFGEALEQIEHEGLRETLTARALAWLSAREQAVAA
jgi:Fe-S cluster assembly protein SufD